MSTTHHSYTGLQLFLSVVTGTGFTITYDALLHFTINTVGTCISAVICSAVVYVCMKKFMPWADRVFKIKQNKNDSSTDSK